MMQGITSHAIYQLNPDGTVRSWNSGARKMTGYVAAEILGEHHSRFFTVADRKLGVAQKILAAAREHGTFESEIQLLRKDGSTFWAAAALDASYDGEGSLTGFAAIIQDISRRRSAEQATLARERRFRSLVEGAVSHAIFMLDPSGIVTSWNTGADRIKGYRADEIIGAHFQPFLHAGGTGSPCACESSGNCGARWRSTRRKAGASERMGAVFSHRR